MAVSSDYAATSGTSTTSANGNGHVHSLSKDGASGAAVNKLPDNSTETTQSSNASHKINSPVEFTGDVNTNNEIPNAAVLKRVENFMLLDRDGRAVQFKDLYSGPNVARSVLVIFIRHFFCGYCQEYVRTLTESVSADTLLHLPVPTFIAVVGCGSPSLIPMYQSETKCPFPIYADPTQALYDALGMVRTLSMGQRPEYQRRGNIKGVLHSIKLGLTQIGGGKMFKAGDLQQVGGEFMFEPVDVSTPICGATDEVDPFAKHSNENMLRVEGEEKRVTWCHRMRNTRDHAELPELLEVLGLDGEGVPGKDKKRWVRAQMERKGTGLSTRNSGSVEETRKSQSSEKLMDQAKA